VIAIFWIAFFKGSICYLILLAFLFFLNEKWMYLFPLVNSNEVHVHSWLKPFFRLFNSQSSICLLKKVIFTNNYINNPEECLIEKLAFFPISDFLFFSLIMRFNDSLWYCWLSTNYRISFTSYSMLNSCQSSLKSIVKFFSPLPE
jgi:hypothetical protein